MQRMLSRNLLLQEKGLLKEASALGGGLRVVPPTSSITLDWKPNEPLLVGLASVVAKCLRLHVGILRPTSVRLKTRVCNSWGRVAPCGEPNENIRIRIRHRCIPAKSK